MQIEAWRVESEVGSQSSWPDSSILVGEWPRLNLWIEGFMSCPVCRVSSIFRTNPIHALPTFWDLADFDQLLGPLKAWILGGTECPKCGVKSTVPKNSRAAFVADIKATLDSDWLRRKFEFADIAIMPRGVVRYEQGKGMGSIALDGYFSKVVPS